MASEIWTAPHMLKQLREMVSSRDGPALVAALQFAIDHRQMRISRPPVPWTVVAALQVLDPDGEDIELFAALRLLQGAQPQKARLGYSLLAEEDAVRIDQELHCAFAPAEVAAVADARGLATSGRPTVVQTAIGLMGPNGSLPYTWTEYANELAKSPSRTHRDDSFAAFLNVLQRRHLAFLFRAWHDCQAVAGADRPQEPHPLAQRLRALAGLALGGSESRDTVAPPFKSAFSAVFARRVKSPLALASMLSRYFGVQAIVEEFVPRWLAIPETQRTQVGVQFATLGTDAVAGERVWDCATRFRIRMRGLSLTRYFSFLPHGEDYAQLRDLVSLYAGPEFEWELVPELLAGEVPPARLPNPNLLLGWSCWLGVRHDDSDAADLSLPMLPKMAPRQPLEFETA